MTTPPTLPSLIQRLSLLLGCTDDFQFIHHQPLQLLFERTRNNGPPQASIIRQPEDFLASEFNKLSTQEQSKALNDLRHAGSELREDPLMIDNLLAGFEQEVERGKYPIYEEALKQDRSYVEDPAFRLLFLRANNHDVKRAVEQMISFLILKAKHFGIEKVASDITIDDMTPEELEIMLSGIYHIQGGEDRNGRVILHRFNRLMPGEFSAETMIRVNYYIWFNILIPMHSVQKKGVVGICYDIMKPGETPAVPGMKSIVEMFEFMACLPIRYSGFHFCLKQEKRKLACLGNMLLGIAVRAIPKHARERSKVHYGSDVELQYQLSKYGIPLDTFPVDANGNLRENILNLWFYERLQEHGCINRNYAANSDESPSEEEDDDVSIVSSLSSNDDERERRHHIAPLPPNTVVDGIWDTDVLLGRGRLVQYHPGNIRFREFLDQRYQRYEALARNQRRHACISFTRQLFANGTRFLRQTGTGLWVVCEFNQVVDKIAQFYRTRRRSLAQNGR